MFLATFHLIRLYLSIQILVLEINSFKPLRYTCECNNSYELWKSIKLGIFLILYYHKFTGVWTFYYEKKAPAWILLRQIKHIGYENFRTYSLNILIAYMWCVAQFSTMCTMCMCYFTKSNTPPWVFFTLFKLYE